MTLPTERLDGCEALAALTETERRRLLDQAVEVSFSPGQEIIREGAKETCFYILLSGQVEILKGGDRVATHGPADVLGEMALFNENVRTASVRSLDDVVALRIEASGIIEDASREEPYAVRLLERLGRVMVERLGEAVRSSARDDSVFQNLFDAMDPEGSGLISRDALLQVLHAWGEPLSRDQITLLMSEIDPGQDGQVDFNRFHRFLLGLTSFNKTSRRRAFQAAYETSTRAIHEALELPISEAIESEAPRRILRPDTINPCVQKMNYEVRGELVLTAHRIEQELKTGDRRNYESVLFCNTGNPQAAGTDPVTFYREVLALCDCPALLKRSDVEALFSPDAVERARTLVNGIPGGTGAYSHSQGVIGIRERVAVFLEERDGFPAFPNDIFLTNGASAAITMVMQVLLAHPHDAVLIPIPQYPIYAATIEMLDAKAVGYYLREDSGWSLDTGELERAVSDARERGLEPRGMVVINPGNPTGQVMDPETLTEIVLFCRRNRLVLLADEVYQENVYDPAASFTSLKKTVRSLGPEFDDFELVSFHSTSKGFIGECGRRGGYMELCGVHADVHAQLFKLASVGLCSNLDGQVMVELMVHPPAPGGPSAERFERETQDILAGLRRKSQQAVAAMNALEGVHCQGVAGSMYVFPKIELPARAIEEARSQGKSPDMHYCLSLLEEAGICVVPGSGFGQRAGTHHLRMTFLPGEAELARALDRFGEHHRWYMERYG